MRPLLSSSSAKRGNLDLLLAVDVTAERLGLTAGLALAQARAMHPALAAVPEDQAGDAHLLEALADWCQRYTPSSPSIHPTEFCSTSAGCAHLFGGEAKLRDDLLARVRGFGPFRPRRRRRDHRHSLGRGAFR